MNRCLLLVGLLVAVVGTVQAAGSVDAGQQKSVLCQGCHGPAGTSLGPNWPNLAGQSVRYLKKQIHDFRAGTRQDPTMSAMAQTIDPLDVDDIVAYFAAQKVGANEDAREASMVASGERIYKGGNSYTGLPACAGCHGPHAAGNGPAAYPRLAGQRVEYVTKALQDFRAGARANDPNEMMRGVAAKLTDSEIRALAAYLASISN